MKIPVPHSFLHMLSVSEWLFYARHWLSECGNSMSFYSILQLHSILQQCRSILIVHLERDFYCPQDLADHQPQGCSAGLGGLSLLLGESRLWVFQEMSDLPGFRVTDQLELRKGVGREGRFPVSPAFVSHMSPRQTNHNHRPDQLWKHRTGNPEHLVLYFL